MLSAQHVTLALVTALWHCAITGEEFWISNFASSSSLVRPCDISHETMAMITGKWRTTNGSHLLQETIVSDFSIACIPYPSGRYGIIPLNRDILTKGKRLPCWILWIPDQEKVTEEWKDTIGRCGRIGWIQVNDDSMVVAVTQLRTPEIAGLFGATAPVLGPITLSTSCEEFWKIVKDHEDEILRAPKTSLIEFQRVKTQDK